MYVNPLYQRLAFYVLLLGALLSLCTCQRWQDPTSNLSTRPFGQLDDLSNVEAQLAGVSKLSTRHQVDSLLVWTVLLKNYAEDIALQYAREATRIATENNLREDQAMGRYYMALLEGRQQVFREGLADPLVNARISWELWEQTENKYWRASIDHLLGDLFYRQEIPDSASYFFELALEELEQVEKEDRSTANLRGSILHGKGILAAENAVHDEALAYFNEALSLYEAGENNSAQLVLFDDFAYLKFDQDSIDQAIDLADSIVTIAGEMEDNYNLANSLQTAGDLLAKKYRSSHNTDFFYEARERFTRSLEVQKDNYFITYRRLGGLMQSRANRDSDRPDYVDSALVYYQLALKSAREEGALDYFRSVSNNISRLCEWLQKSKNRDCAEILGTSASSYLFNNYSGVVDTITQSLTVANANLLDFELQQQQQNSRRRIRSLWIIAAVILLFGALISLLVYQRQKQMRLQSRMEALRAQINPHFFSNSLNAIEGLVNLDQRKAASKYLIHFSRLTRRVLNSSLEASTTLAGELETTKHFLALEQLRFKDKLHYEILIADDVNPNLVEVPSLIFQPYLENAIWHGIKPKDDPSLLQISIYREGKVLRCSIEDDGIGRAAAQKQKESTVLHRKSVGMKITKERLLSFGGGTVDLVDLYHDDGTARGTKVVLSLPYKIYKG